MSFVYKMLQPFQHLCLENDYLKITWQCMNSSFSGLGSFYSGFGLCQLWEKYLCLQLQLYLLQDRLSVAVAEYDTLRAERLKQNGRAVGWNMWVDLSQYYFTELIQIQNKRKLQTHKKHLANINRVWRYSIVYITKEGWKETWSISRQKPSVLSLVTLSKEEINLSSGDHVLPKNSRVIEGNCWF